MQELQDWRALCVGSGIAPAAAKEGNGGNASPSSTADDIELDVMVDGKVCLEESMWDASLLLGIQGQGLACTVWGLLILLLNMLVQVQFPPSIIGSNVCCTRMMAQPNMLEAGLFAKRPPCTPFRSPALLCVQATLTGIILRYMIIPEIDSDTAAGFRSFHRFLVFSCKCEGACACICLYTICFCAEIGA